VGPVVCRTLMQPSQPQRLRSLDQFRGFTVAAMFAVNFLAGFSAVHPWLQHHRTWCSLADLVMPMFLFAVGFSMRMAFLRHAEKAGRSEAMRMAVRRALALILLGLVVHGIDGRFATWDALQQHGLDGFVSSFWRRSPFQALVHIGVVTLWTLPVIGRSWRVQVVWMSISIALHVALSAAGWHAWLLDNAVIDGGALGFLAWTAPMLAGSLACMRIQHVGAAAAVQQFVAAGACAMTIGYALSCLTNGGVLAAPPLCEPWHPRDMWTMSQQAASASYVVFGAGFSLLAYAAFVQQADLRARELPLFRTLGCNALAGYVLHGLVEDLVRPYAPNDSPLWWALAMFAVFFAITWSMLRGMERQGLFVRL